MFKNPLYVYGPRNVEVPMNLNFGELMFDKMKMHKDKVAFINAETNESITYGGMMRQTMVFAVYLTRSGLKRKDVVGILSENRNEFWGAIIGVACAGAVVTTLSTSYEASELKHALNISMPKYIVISPTMYKKHQKTLRTISFIEKIILLGSEKFENTILFNDLMLMSTNVNVNNFICADVKGQTDTLFIIYSSGTTGLAKGVMLTHLNVIVCCCLPLFMDPNKMALGISPWYHSMGLVGSLAGLCYGRTGVYLSKFSLDTYLKTIETYKISQLTVVPPVLVAVCKYPSNYDLSSVKLIYSGAAPLNKETVIEVYKKFPNAEAVFQGYGASETTLAVTRMALEDIPLAKEKMGSIGKPTAGTIIKVVDIHTGQVVGPKQHGEICVKGPVIMKGYVGKNRSEGFDEEGFYKTGDIGYYDEGGYFYIVDRLKELIKYKGFQVPPAELEDVLLTHPAVKDVGVIGVPDKLSGEVPRAFIVLQPGSQVDEEEFKRYIADRLSNPKHLRGGVRFVDHIPKSVSGKILRKELRNIGKVSKSKL